MVFDQTWPILVDQSTLPLCYNPYGSLPRIKRIFDIIASALGLLVLSPLFLILGCAVKLSSPGPILYRQIRIGEGGKRFELLKFRSMVDGADNMQHQLMILNEASGPVFKMRRDPRVTPIGRFIRKFSLDELPQLWNIFKGDMSLVGPRPPLPSEVRTYLPWQLRRLSVPQGLTCIWQVSGRSNVAFDEWVQLDLRYIDSWSFLLDISIIAKTFIAVFRGTGAF